MDFKVMFLLIGVLCTLLIVIYVKDFNDTIAGIFAAAKDNNQLYKKVCLIFFYKCYYSIFSMRLMYVVLFVNA